MNATTSHFSSNEGPLQIFNTTFDGTIVTRGLNSRELSFMAINRPDEKKLTKKDRERVQHIHNMTFSDGLTIAAESTHKKMMPIAALHLRGNKAIKKNSKL